MPRIPLAVWLVGIAAALLHIAPYWHAELQTPPGWTFVYNITRSPDLMQYRVWARQSQRSGPIVPNTFTTEPNRPYLPVVFYYLIGKVAAGTGLSPEVVYAYAGSFLAVALTVLLFWTVRLFLTSGASGSSAASTSHAVWWVFLAILVGGGLTGHLKLLAASRAHLHVPLIGTLLIQPLRNWMVWEDYRSHYVIFTLFDTHFLLVWLVTTAAVVALYLTLRAFSPWRLLATGVLYATTTVVHVYEGVTLMAITAAVLLVCWRRQQVTRSVAAQTAAVCALAIGGCIGLFFLLQQRSGLPAPSWQAVNILFSTFVLAYPLAWALIAWGLAGYWRRAQLEECFLLGWALGCTAVTLSGPFYPYPDRGTMTLQIPLFIIAGAIYFARRKRVGRLAAAVAILILVATPVFAVYNRWDATRFDRTAPHKFLGPQHKAILSALRGRASARDLLIAEPDDVLWLGPEHPGRHFCGHFFLTVRYDEKCAVLAQFFESPAPEQVDFLQRTGARFLYVDEAREPARFASLPGLERLVATDAGALFEVRPEKRDGSR